MSTLELILTFTTGFVCGAGIMFGIWTIVDTNRRKKPKFIEMKSTWDFDE